MSVIAALQIKHILKSRACPGPVDTRVFSSIVPQSVVTQVTFFINIPGRLEEEGSVWGSKSHGW
jgi:hypothetical protein